jgi:hypothetical protein
MTLPGSCTARAGRHRSSCADSSLRKPVTRNVSGNSSPPACEMSPELSADTMITRWDSREKCLLNRGGQDSRQARSPQLKGTFLMSRIKPAQIRRESLRLTTHLAYIAPALHRPLASISHYWLLQTAMFSEVEDRNRMITAAHQLGSRHCSAFAAHLRRCE